MMKFRRFFFYFRVYIFLNHTKSKRRYKKKNKFQRGDGFLEPIDLMQKSRLY